MIYHVEVAVHQIHGIKNHPNLVNGSQRIFGRCKSNANGYDLKATSILCRSRESLCSICFILVKRRKRTMAINNCIRLPIQSNTYCCHRIYARQHTHTRARAHAMKKKTKWWSETIVENLLVIVVYTCGFQYINKSSQPSTWIRSYSFEGNKMIRYTGTSIGTNWKQNVQMIFQSVRNAIQSIGLYSTA